MNEPAPANPLGRFLTLVDAAEILSVSVGEIHELVNTGELPAIRVGIHGQWRIEREVFEGYIEALYEEARRVGLWNQAAFVDLAELSVPRSTVAPRL